MGKRENNYDLLRIICSFGVIVIHDSGIWITNAIKNINHGIELSHVSYIRLACLYNLLSRFAVPCFVMMSGAFILNCDDNQNYKQFYRKSLYKIFLPTVFFSAVCVIYRIICSLADGTAIGSIINDIIKGYPMYHLWYLNMLAGLYLFAPVVIRYKKSISERTFYLISIIFSFWACISNWTSKSLLTWDIGNSFEYLGYFMAGYTIYKIKKKNNILGMLSTGAGLLILIIPSKLLYDVTLKGIYEEGMEYRITTPYFPLIMIASFAIFYGFSCFTVNKNLAAISSLTFYIYIVHAIVLDLILRIIPEDVFAAMSSLWMIPALSMVIFVISAFISWFCNKIPFNRIVLDDNAFSKGKGE